MLTPTLVSSSQLCECVNSRARARAFDTPDQDWMCCGRHVRGCAKFGTMKRWSRRKRMGQVMR